MKAVLFITMLLAWFTAVHAQTGAKNSPVNNNSDQTQSQFAAVRILVSAKNNQYELKLVNAKLISGVYRKQNDDLNLAKPNDLVFYVLNERQETVETVLISNPLSTRLEYPADNHQTINSTVINKNQEEVLLRFNYAKDIKNILVKKFDAEKRLVTIASLPLIIN